ncbi:MAG: aspartate aminotransferase family protein [Gammaproteobacteria bacterium]|nr:aspartate aminotransferase family protein [Gammaproteobacteria bacterium]
MFNSPLPQDSGPQAGGGQTAFYARSNKVPLPLIEKASGIYFWDSEGNRYIDVSSGPVVSNIGHGNSTVAERMAEQAKTMEYAFPRLARNHPNIEYSGRLAELAGPGFERVHLTSGGSEAMENAIKFLRQYAIATGKSSKTRIITCEPSYHGATIATLAMNGEILMQPFLDGFAEPSVKVPAPLNYRTPAGYDAAGYALHCAKCLDSTIQKLGKENVLAFVIEPIGGLSTGCVVPPGEYFSHIREICTRHDVHLVFDEILCGMGRTGRFLAAHHWPEAMPDIITLAKGLASGYSPLGAVLAPAVMVDKLADLSGFEFQYSYNANPVSCAAGLAVLEEYENRDLVNRADSSGKKILAGLKRLKTSISIIGDIRGMGMLLAVELVADPKTKQSFPNEFCLTDKIRIYGLNHGLMIYSRQTSGGKYGHWFLVSPPLTISDEEIDELLEGLGSALSELQANCLESGRR